MHLHEGFDLSEFSKLLITLWTYSSLKIRLLFTLLCLFADMADSFSDLEDHEYDEDQGEDEHEAIQDMAQPQMPYMPGVHPQMPYMPPGAFYHPQGFHYMPVPHQYYANNYVPDGPVASLGSAASASLGTPATQQEVEEPQEDEEVAALLVEDATLGEAVDSTLATTVNKVWNNGRVRQVLKTI